MRHIPYYITLAELFLGWTPAVEILPAIEKSAKVTVHLPLTDACSAILDNCANQVG